MNDKWILLSDNWRLINQSQTAKFAIDFEFDLKKHTKYYMPTINHNGIFEPNTFYVKLSIYLQLYNGLKSHLDYLENMDLLSEKGINLFEQEIKYMKEVLESYK